MRYLLDTHAWIWLTSGSASVPSRVNQMIRDARVESLLVSAISVWEFSKLVEKGRLQIACDGAQWIRQALDQPKLRLVELSPEIAWESTRLPGDFHSDPADQIIVATARHEGAILLTADAMLRRYPHVKSEW